MKHRKEDIRVIRTKEKLYFAFCELLSEKQFENITVNEICERADIRRATFYKHFNDKYSFLADMTAALIHKFDEHISIDMYRRNPVEYHTEYVKKLLGYLCDNSDIVNLIFKSNMLPNLATIIIQENYKKTKERLLRNEENGSRLVASVDTVATVLAGGIGSMIISWFEGGCTTPTDDLISEAEKIVKAMFL